jgi:hypothetical protein
MVDRIGFNIFVNQMNNKTIYTKSYDYAVEFVELICYFWFIIFLNVFVFSFDIWSGNRVSDSGTTSLSTVGAICTPFSYSIIEYAGFNTIHAAANNLGKIHD